MNPNIQALLHKAKDSLQAAILLNTEGYPDFSASRAYYAMLYIAEAMLLEKGLSFSSHAAVIAAFGKEFAKTGKVDAKFHRYLIDAQDFRNEGDYGVGPGVSRIQADELIGWAQEFLCLPENE
jgi:uncharacterized protein (UPF0332 family)